MNLEHTVTLSMQSSQFFCGVTRAPPGNTPKTKKIHTYIWPFPSHHDKASWLYTLYILTYLLPAPNPSFKLLDLVWWSSGVYII